MDLIKSLKHYSWSDGCFFSFPLISICIPSNLILIIDLEIKRLCFKTNLIIFGVDTLREMRNLFVLKKNVDLSIIILIMRSISL